MIVGIAMVKDEADIIARSVGNMLTQVDRVIVADNGSTDGTREILAELDVTLINDPEPAYYQSAKMTKLAQKAGQMGARWVVPFDADELWYSPFGTIKDVLNAIPANWRVASAQLYDHVATAVDPHEALDPVARISWRRVDPLPLPKVAARFHPDLIIHQGNHGASYTYEPGVLPGQLVVRHFPYRSVEQFIRKVRNGAAAYKAAVDLNPDFGGHWRKWGEILEAGGEEAVAEIFHTWYWRQDPAVPLTIGDEEQPALIYDPCPSN